MADIEQKVYKVLIQTHKSTEYLLDKFAEQLGFVVDRLCKRQCLLRKYFVIETKSGRIVLQILFKNNEAVDESSKYNFNNPYFINMFEDPSFIRSFDVWIKLFESDKDLMSKRCSSGITTNTSFKGKMFAVYYGPCSIHNLNRYASNCDIISGEKYNSLEILGYIGHILINQTYVKTTVERISGDSVVGILQNKQEIRDERLPIIEKTLRQDLPESKPETESASSSNEISKSQNPFMENITYVCVYNKNRSKVESIQVSSFSDLTTPRDFIKIISTSLGIDVNKIMLEIHCMAFFGNKFHPFHMEFNFSETPTCYLKDFMTNSIPIFTISY